MFHKNRWAPHFGLFLVTLALLLNIVSSMAWAVDPINALPKHDVAIHGADTVAYFTKRELVKGNPDIVAEWMGKRWLFATEENREIFVKEPNKYAPQYGGYCAFAAASGKALDTDPDAWRIVDDKLYLNFSKDVQSLWVRDMRSNISKADKAWPKLVDQATPLD